MKDRGEGPSRLSISKKGEEPTGVGVSETYLNTPSRGRLIYQYRNHFGEQREDRIGGDNP